MAKAVAQDPIRKMKALGKMLEDEDCRTIAVQALKEAAVGAYRSFGIGDGQYQTEPDYATRIRAAAILLSYTDGQPVERQLVVTHEAKTITAEQHAETIARALRLPAGFGEKLLKKKAAENGAAS